MPREFKVLANNKSIAHKDCKSIRSRIQKLANNFDIENSRNESRENFQIYSKLKETEQDEQLKLQNTEINNLERKLGEVENSNKILRVRSYTGMDIITGTNYRNGHYSVALCALNVFYLHKM